MNLMRIQYFVEVAKSENFSEAARNLYTSQPNLSRQIAVMEQELGFALFHRVGRSIYLTQAGQYLYEQFKDIPEQTAKAIAHAGALARGDVGSLRVGILEGQEINTFFAQQFRRITDERPDLSLEVERNSFSNLRSGLLQCRYDLIITLSFELDSLSAEEPMEHEIVLPQSGAIAISRKNPLAEKSDLTLADLKDEPFVAISYSESPAGYQQLLEQCAVAGFAPKISRHANTLESLLLCVEAGMGISLLDCNTRLEHNENVRIIPIPGSAESHVVAVWQTANNNPAVRRLAEELKAQSST